MRQFLIMANMPPYTVKITFIQEATKWEDVIMHYPDAELIKEI